MWRKRLSIFGLFILSVSLLFADLPSEDILSEPDNPLMKSIDLIENTIILLENTRTDNEKLKMELIDASESLKEQKQIQAEQSQIYARQSILLSRELKKTKLLKVSLAVSVPTFTAIGIWIGSMLN